MPTVSICVPTFNGSRYLEECLESAVQQTYNDSEVIVVDDCSSDDSFELAERFARRNSRVRVYRNEENRGLVVNWNRCIELATGAWIKFLFQDDLLDPFCVESMLRVAARPVVFCRRRIISSGPVSDHPIHLAAMTTLWELVGEKTDIPPDEISRLVIKHRMNFFGEPTAALLHRSVFAKFGTFNADFKQMCDIEYWMRVCTNTGISYAPEVLATFRYHAHSTSALHYNTDERHRPDRFDEVLLLHEFAYNDHYKALRQIARTSTATDFRRELANAAFTARRKFTSRRSDVRAEAAANWRRLVQSYPHLHDPAMELPIVLKEFRGRARHEWRNMKRHWDRHIGWRFSRR